MKNEKIMTSLLYLALGIKVLIDTILFYILSSNIIWSPLYQIPWAIGIILIVYLTWLTYKEDKPFKKKIGLIDKISAISIVAILILISLLGIQKVNISSVWVTIFTLIAFMFILLVRHYIKKTSYTLN